MLLVFGVIALSLILIALVPIYLKYSRLIRHSQDWPSPPGLPLIGHGHYLINKPSDEILRVLRNFFTAYGDSVKLWIGPELNIVLNDPKDIELVIGGMKINDKADVYNQLHNWLREGLLVSNGRKWFKRRKILTPAFHFTILEQFIDIFEQKSRTFINNLTAESKINAKEGFDIYNWINLCTLEIICETAMGVSIDAQTNFDSDYVVAVKTISMVLHKRMFDLLYRFNVTYMFTKLAREERKALAVLHGYSEKIIVQRREELLKKQQYASKSQNAEEDRDIGVKRKMAFLDILLQSKIDGQPLTNLDIREEVDTFMFEGHDTTSSAVMFFFYNIAKNREHQKKCFDEIRSVFGDDKSTPVSYEQLNKLNHVEMCIKETLRLFPSVPLSGRKVTEDCVINGRKLPAGTNILFSPLHLGRLETNFPDAQSFKPERFDVLKNAEKNNPYAYIPFSAGPRNCIGQKFAMFEIKTIVANVLRHFEIEYVGDPNDELVLVAELILRTRDPLMFKIKPRVY